MPMNRRHLLASAAAGLALPWSLPSAAQAWPARPIRLVSPYGAGGSNDILTRVLGDFLSRRLGQSAIHVTDICMGTMTFGSQTDEAEALRILDRCFDEGINFYDTAEGYPVPPDIKWVGRTEEIVGRWLKTKNRDAIILATKVSGPSHLWFKSPCRGGMTALDRHNIRSAIEGSLRRLRTDYVDLYQTHWPDPDAPYDEMMDALDDQIGIGSVAFVPEEQHLAAVGDHHEGVVWNLHGAFS